MFDAREAARIYKNIGGMFPWSRAVMCTGRVGVQVGSAVHRPGFFGNFLLQGKFYFLQLFLKIAVRF